MSTRPAGLRGSNAATAKGLWSLRESRVTRRGEIRVEVKEPKSITLRIAKCC